MRKTFNELMTDDDVYVIAINDTKVNKEKISSTKVINVGRSKLQYNRAINVILDNNDIIYPHPDRTSHMQKPSFKQINPYKQLTAKIYATSKEECIKAAIDAIKDTIRLQEITVERMNEILNENKKNLETASVELRMSDSKLLESFAEMAL